jgi:UDP-N-acetylglucosamine:LPS N-acetylglucosamine transferase
MTKPIVITGGGTGGHVFPMLAIAEQLRLLGVSPSRLRYVGSRRGQEATLLAGDPVALTLLPGRGLRRSFARADLGSNVVAITELVGAISAALFKTGKWRPAVVVSVGGYASFAASLAAIVWRSPLVLVEFDAAPGAAQRILTRFARRRCTAFESHDPRAVTTGAPLREAIETMDRSDDHRRVVRRALSPPIDDDRRVVVVMTGSLGSHRVNSAVSELATLWSHRSDRTLIHVTGRRDFNAVVAARPTTSDFDYRIVEFGDMVELWELCDVALCRSGAITIAELTALGIASVLVPLPGAPHDHQTKNARAVVAAGGARMIRDADCTAQTLAVTLDEILEPKNLAAMSALAASLGRRNAARAIAQVVLEIGGGA